MLWTLRVIAIITSTLVVFALLPEIPLPDPLVSAIVFLFGSVYQFNHILDIDTLFLVLSLYLFVEGVLLLVRFIKWLLNVVRN